MNDETALQTIEAFFRRKASRAEYEAALSHFQNDPVARQRLNALYRDLVAPGGMSHDEAGELMLLFDDRLAWRDVPEADRRRFLLHLTECEDCAEEFLELRDWDETPVSEVAVMPRFKLPTARTTPQGQTTTLPTGWRMLVEKVEVVSGKLRANLKLRPVQTTTRGIAEESVLYSPRPNELLSVRKAIAGRTLMLGVTATGPASCTVTITTQAATVVTLRYASSQAQAVTDQNGRAVFPNVPQNVLPRLDIELLLQR